MSAGDFDERVELYIHKAQPFAQPILNHLRALVHKACPQVEETIKWSRPFFEYKGAILGNLSGFKEHCSFGFWGEEIGATLREAKVVQEGAMGTLGRITSLDDLPSDKLLLTWIRQAVAFVDEGKYTSPIAARRTPERRVVKATPETPAEFTAALRKSRQASKVFAAFSPSCQKEYIEWIADAKRPETRTRRITQAIEWIAEGKQRHWKYQP